MQQLDNVLWAISIHALREEGDMPILRACLVRCLFLSTPSARRATGRFRLRRFLAEFLSTPSARRATQPRTPYAYERAISIHALCEEGDSGCCTSSSSPTDFYPRPLRGGRRPCHRWRFRGSPISIHALCEEGDPRSRSSHAAPRYFYPRPLRGGRHADSVPGADCENISIHALCEEGDVVIRIIAAWSMLFLSTPSARRATLYALIGALPVSDFYPRPLRGGRHGNAELKPGMDENFYPRPLRGGRPIT